MIVGIAHIRGGGGLYARLSGHTHRPHSKNLKFLKLEMPRHSRPSRDPNVRYWG